MESLKSLSFFLPPQFGLPPSFLRISCPTRFANFNRVLSPTECGGRLNYVISLRGSTMVAAPGKFWNYDLWNPSKWSFEELIESLWPQTFWKHLPYVWQKVLRHFLKFPWLFSDFLNVLPFSLIFWGSIRIPRLISLVVWILS